MIIVKDNETLDVKVCKTFKQAKAWMVKNLRDGLNRDFPGQGSDIHADEYTVEYNIRDTNSMTLADKAKFIDDELGGIDICEIIDNLMLDYTK